MEMPGTQESLGGEVESLSQPRCPLLFLSCQREAWAGLGV